MKSIIILVFAISLLFGVNFVYAQSAPDAPTNLTITPGNGQAILSWTAPTNPNITHYIIEYRYDSTWSSFSTWALDTNLVYSRPLSTATSATVSNLTNGVEYEFRVKAVIDTYEGKASRAISSIPGVPGTPTNLTATPGNHKVTLTWDAPDDNGSPITNYHILYKRSDKINWIQGTRGANTTVTFEGLKNDFSYEYRVRAVNANGEGYYTAKVFATPETLPPDPPRDLTVTAGTNQANLSWKAPNSNGSAITHYIIEYRHDSTWTSITTDSTTITISNLAKGAEYDFRVIAVNGEGSGNPSIISAILGAPNSPTNLVAKPGNSQVNLSWKAPADSHVTHYIIEYKFDQHWLGLSTNSTATSFTISNLINGTEYEFRVIAANRTGTSNPSLIVLSTPGAPDPPTNLSVTPGNHKVRLVWTPPADNGSKLENYYVLVRKADGQNWTTVKLGVGSAAIISNLGNGTLYEFKLYAGNAAGVGPESNSVFATPGRPGQPINLSAIPDDGHVTIFWNAPPGRGSHITHYVAEYRSDTKWSSKPIYSTGTIGILFGLKNDTSYEIRISAVNNVGKGAPSKSIFVTPSAESAPSEPLNVIAKPNNKKVSLTWDIPLKRNPQITHYDVRYNDGNGWKEIPFATSKHRNYTASNLTNGVEYEFQVRAKNIDGEIGSWSASVFATPAVAPQPPTNLSSKSSDMKIKLSWDAPIDNGGSKIIDYIIEYNHNNNWQIFDDGTSNKTTSTVTGLTNGTSYEFRVSAKNAVKQGEASDILSAIPATTPSAPTNFKVEPNSNQNLILFWDEPKNDGGSPITHYKVYYRTHSTWSTPAYVTTSDTFIAITDLNTGFYIITVQAVNDIGGGKMSKAISKQIG